MELIKLLSPYAVALFSVVLSGVAYAMKKLYNRIDELETQQARKPSRQEMKQAIHERVSHIDKHIDRVDYKLDKIIDILIKRE